MQDSILMIIQLVLAIFLIAIIAIQQKGSGLSGVFGGTSNIYSTKRGIDKILFYTTIVLSATFFALGLIRFF
ncbi:MAG: preprotein translocase subunit SecG [Candidatus Magasanikbacteria bacterium RIFCSPLOWO2_02_FULL_44_11]|uniref:Protein-export membrane protein SecG n=2 Tax=Candidatus Magasanikiibacteriota TaxID=1752731 RepID=A0A1F6N9X1_9BACT|nr:MAG: preprotein translocase subunit SecG [Candidatus Magasanikbacteria bacterium RIFCSPHIGHO2_02_FULL_45_10]OGH80724.1 MAG: preprotein translocase subunit SecG [Candidatus Magasanikbacteria bacterium RIFCSPLOWO2_02_FULL_44_11]